MLVFLSFRLVNHFFDSGCRRDETKMTIMDALVEMAYIVILFTLSMKLINITFAGGVLRIVVFLAVPSTGKLVDRSTIRNWGVVSL